MHRFDSVEWPDVIGWKLDPVSSRLRLQGVGSVRLRMHRPVTVFCTNVPQQLLPTTGKSVGIDMGVSYLVALSDGRTVASPRHLRRSADRIAEAQRRVAAGKPGSRRRRAAVARLGVLHRRVRNQRRDFLHKVSRILVDEHDLIAVEGLRVANMVRRPRPRPDGKGGFEPNWAAVKAAAVGWIERAAAGSNFDVPRVDTSNMRT